VISCLWKLEDDGDKIGVRNQEKPKLFGQVGEMTMTYEFAKAVIVWLVALRIIRNENNSKVLRR
jgi:hypothetical protein